MPQSPAPMDGRTYRTQAPRREGLFTETPLTPRGKVAVGALGAAVLATSIVLLPNKAPSNPERATHDEVAANKAAIMGITQLANEKQILPGGTEVFAQPNENSTVRFTVGEGKLTNKGVLLDMAGILDGQDKQGNHEVFEAFMAPMEVSEASSPTSTTIGQAERLVYVPVPLSDLPQKTLTVDYISGPDGSGTFETQGGKGSDGAVLGADQQIAALQSSLVDY